MSVLEFNVDPMNEYKFGSHDALCGVEEVFVNRVKVRVKVRAVEAVCLLTLLAI